MRLMKGVGALPILGAIWCSGVAAQEAVTPEPKVLSKWVVTAEAQRQSATQNTTVLTSEQIDAQQAINLDDLVRYIPGVEVSDLGRFGANGFNIRGLDGDQVGLSIDGLSFGETLDPASYQPYDFFRGTRGGLDVDALKSVEIIKGADSVASGSGGLSGAVLFVTKDPEDYLALQGDDLYLGAKAGYASANSETALTGTFAGRLGVWETLLVATKRQGHETEVQGEGGDVTGARREQPDPLDSDALNVLFKLVNRFTENQRLGLVAEHYKADSQLNNLSRVDNVYRTRTTDDEAKRQRIGVNYEWLTTQGAFDSLTASYDFQTSDTRGYTRMLFASGTCPQASSPCYRSEDRHYQQDTHTALLRFTKTLSAGASQHDFLYGMGADQRDVSYASVDTRYVGQSTTIGTLEVDPDLVPATRVRHVNVYLRDVIDMVDRPWRFRLGGRFDRYHYAPSFNAQYQDASATVSKVNVSALTWQSGLDWKLLPTHTLSAQVGTGFRAPSTDNLYAPTSTSPGTDPISGAAVVLWDSVANPNLKSEKSLNTELAYDWRGDRHDLKLAVFRDKYSNFIETQTLLRQVGSITDDYLMPVNAGEVIVKGVEVSGYFAMTPSWALRLAYSYNEGEKGNGDPLVSIVPASGVVGVEYQSPQKRLAASINLTHAAAKKASDTMQTDDNGVQTQATSFLSQSYSVLDLQARYQLTPALKLTAGIFNLLDEQYWRWSRVRFLSAGTGGARGGVSGQGLNRYAEPGRNYRVSMTYAF